MAKCGCRFGDSYGLKNYHFGLASMSEDARGRWYATPRHKPMRQLALFNESVDIDLGLREFATRSDGAVVEAQPFNLAVEEKVVIAQRANKKTRVKAIHAKIANRRNGFQHKLGTRLVRAYGAIFVGNVNASAIAKATQAKSVLDAGWSTFWTMLQSKCHEAGVWVEEVNEAYSTQTCSGCQERTRPTGRGGRSANKNVTL